GPTSADGTWSSAPGAARAVRCGRRGGGGVDPAIRTPSGPAIRPAIRTSGLAKRYRHQVALHGIDLEVPPEVVFGYLGPNGAGKTTTIRLLAGLLRPTSGRAESLGLDIVRDRGLMQRSTRYPPGHLVS